MPLQNDDWETVHTFLPKKTWSQVFDVSVRVPVLKPCVLFLLAWFSRMQPFSRLNSTKIQVVTSELKILAQWRPWTSRSSRCKDLAVTRFIKCSGEEFSDIFGIMWVMSPTKSDELFFWGCFFPVEMGHVWSIHHENEMLLCHFVCFTDPKDCLDHETWEGNKKYPSCSYFRKRLVFTHPMAQDGWFAEEQT